MKNWFFEWMEPHWVGGRVSFGMSRSSLSKMLDTLQGFYIVEVLLSSGRTLYGDQAVDRHQGFD